jgi:5'-3' exonuclease
MGLHFFYKWVTTRYPMIKKPFEMETAPQIDHLYVDLNSVLRRCLKDTSALFKDLLCAKKLEEIFVSIINYTNFVINIIKPRKTLFIVIDGVSPRAKMNNQRNHRFMNSKRQRTFDEFLLNTLKISPEMVYFKNHSISPGTEFMIELNRHIRFLIQRKIHEDENWRHLKIVFSGGDVPGEGIHKIQSYIRHTRISGGLQMTDTHCIYGNDSDLFLSCLLNRLPYFVILREEFVYSKKPVVNSAANRQSEEQKMELMYINILKEYFEMEFKSVLFKDENYLERVLDDFVLLSYFVKNDFLQQIYCMSTNMEIFDEFIEKIMQYYKSNGKFLVDKQNIDWESFYGFLKTLIPFQGKMMNKAIRDFEKRIVELEQNKFYGLMKKQRELKNSTVEDSNTQTNKFEDDRLQENLFDELLKFKNIITTGNRQMEDQLFLDNSEIKNEDQKNNKSLELFQKAYTNNKKDYSVIVNGNKSIMNENTERVSKIANTHNNLSLLDSQIKQYSHPAVQQNSTLSPKLENQANLIEQVSSESYDEGKQLQRYIKEIHKESLEKKKIEDDSIFEKCLVDQQTLQDLEEKTEECYICEFKDQYEKLTKAKDVMQEILNLFLKGQNYRSLYYKEYFGISESIDIEMNKICHSYLNGVDFAFKYYSSGCPSWEWHYKYNLSPSLSDICNYLKRAFDNGKKIQFDYPPSRPCPPYIHLLYILPKGSLELLPQTVVKEAVSENSPIVRFYPDHYELRAFDNHKNSAWFPTFEHYCNEQMNKFIAKLDWINLLSDEDKRRNANGLNIEYAFDEDSETLVEPSVCGLEPVKANIKISAFSPDDEFPKNHNILNHSNEIQMPPKDNVFPSLKSIPHLKFRKIKEKDRYICALYITVESIKQIYKEFTNFISEPAPESYYHEKTASCDPIFQRTYRFRDIKWLDSENSNCHAFFKNTEDLFASSGIFIEKREEIFQIFDKIPFIMIQQPFFSFVNFSKPPIFAPKVQIKSIEQQLSPIAFFAAYWRKPFPKLLSFTEGYFKDAVSQNRLKIDLTTGILLQVKRPLSAGGTIKYSVIRNAINIEKLKIPLEEEDLILIDEKFLWKLGLKLNELKILWLILDSVKIFCDQQNHSTLVIGEAFDIGLNFISFLNKDIEQWRLVSDMVKIQSSIDSPIKSYSSPNIVNNCAFIYSSGNNFPQKIYNLYLTKRGEEAVFEYFEENKPIVNYLKAHSEKLTSVHRMRSIPWYKCHFDAPLVFNNKKIQDVNIELFAVYASLVKKNYSSLKLQPSFGLNFPINLIFEKIILFNSSLSRDENKTADSLTLVGYTPHCETIWPPMRKKPCYHETGDRVVVVTSHHAHIKFGMSGVIIGVYKEIIEVFFDEPFIGATNLHGRCPNFRGFILNFFDVFNLSKWTKLLIRSSEDKQEEEKIWEGDFDLSDLIKLIRKNEQGF